MKKIKLPKTRLDLAEYLLVAAIIVAAGFIGWYVLAAEHNAFDSYDKAGNVSMGAVGSKKKNPSSQQSDGQKSTTDQPKPPIAPPNTPFSITKVYFAQAPKVPPGAGFGQCTVGQVINYSATAQVTAASKGTMTYHWEVADHLGGTIDKQSDQTLSIASTGTSNISTDLSYTVRNTGNGTNLYNRQYINLFVTAPNDIYANKDNPVYAYKNSTEPFFVWGTYIDLC